MIIDISIYEASIIPAIIVLTWIAKVMGLPTRFLPIVCLVLGVIAGLTFVSADGTGVLTGVLMSATAIGFHSGTKNILPRPEEIENAKK